MNDDDRAQWVNNDERLYSAWRSSRLSLRKYVAEFRAELTEYINKQLNREPKS